MLARPPVGSQQRREHLHERRLAGAVGAEQAEHGPGLDGQVEAVERDDVPEGLAHALGVDGGGHGSSPAARRVSTCSRHSSASLGMRSTRNSASAVIAISRARRSSGASASTWRPGGRARRAPRTRPGTRATARRRTGGSRRGRRARPAVRLAPQHPARVSSVLTAAPTALRLICSASAISAAVCAGGSQISSQPATRPVAGGMPYWRAKKRPTWSAKSSSASVATFLRLHRISGMSQISSGGQRPPPDRARPRAACSAAAARRRPAPRQPQDRRRPREYGRVAVTGVPPTRPACSAARCRSSRRSAATC